MHCVVLLGTLNCHLHKILLNDIVKNIATSKVRQWMYIHKYICTYILVHTYIHTYVRTYIRTYIVCMYVCMYVCTYVCVYVCMCVCMYVCIMYVCITYVCVYVYVMYMRSRTKTSTKNDNVHGNLVYKNVIVNIGGVKGRGGRGRFRLERCGTRSTCTGDDMRTTLKTICGTHTSKHGEFTAQYYETRSVTEQGMYALATTTARYKKFSLQFVSWCSRLEILSREIHVKGITV